ncbi:hypothetical protein VTL71DRAFT_11958 [Oculimacula yallundae]|uniref:Uncharacterized protein n=1 Tax=Oculimacula yallundae TaxID=86028 RepID=A0ABR4CRM6_9HELO
MFSRVSIAIVALAWPRSALSANTAPCFYPDGSKAVNDIPCFSSNSLSRICCAPNQVCSTNGLCVTTDPTVTQQTFRGSCLDPAFGPSCPTFCLTQNRNTQNPVVSCGDPKAGNFCCDEGKGPDCCATPAKILALGVGMMSPAASGTISTGIMLNAPATQSPAPVVSLQTTTIVSISTVTSVQVSTPVTSQSPATPVAPPGIIAAQPAIAQPNPSSSLPPSTPFLPAQPPKKEEELFRPSAPANSSFGSRTGVEAAIIAEAAVRQPATSTAAPLSAGTVASASIGAVVIVTLIIVISVMMLRRRIARKAEETKAQEEAAGAKPHDREKGTDTSGGPGPPGGGAGPPQVERNVHEVGGPMGLAALNQSRGDVPPMRPAREAANPFRSPLPSPQWQNQERYQARASEMFSKDYNRNSDPFQGGTPLPQPGRGLGDGQRGNEATDSPTKGYYNERQSEWSLPTLTTAHPDHSPRVDRTRGVSELDREVDAMRSKYPEQYRDRNTTFSDDSNIRNPPEVETSNGMRVPAAGLERRISGPGPETMNSQTFQKLLYDVQSRPF